MTSRPQKVERLFEFLCENHHFNRVIQEDFLRQTLYSCETIEERARLLLYKIVNTQSQPKLDPIQDFFQRIANDKKSLSNFKEFSQFLSVNSQTKSGLFKALEGQAGWGPKTSALLIRNLAMIERRQDLRSRFWLDLDVIESKEVYLPVDAVIKSIFQRFTERDLDLRKSAPCNFDGINVFLKEKLNYTNSDILIWDDLWFWGFITQSSKSDKQNRTYGWNSAKYWSIFSAPKDNVSISEIRSLAREFLKLTAPKGP